MNLIYEIVSVGLIYIAGSLLGRFVPVPASLLSMVLFFLLLVTGVLREERYRHISKIILGNLAFFFLPPAIRILDSMDVISGNLLKLVVVLVISNFLVMGVSGLVVQRFLKKEESDV